MKVKYLQSQLSKMNPDAEVKLNNYNGDTALFVNARLNDNNVVWLDGEHDMDLGAELDARFKNATEYQIDELDFYMELLDIGITIDIVRKYMGNEVADHMEIFCEEHGLLDDKEQV